MPNENDLMRPHDPVLADNGNPLWFYLMGPAQHSAEQVKAPEQIRVHLCRRCGCIYGTGQNVGDVCPATTGPEAAAPSQHPWGIPFTRDP